VFQALLAGAKARWSDARAEAFGWLESLPAPQIWAPDAGKSNPLLTYVPNNNESPARTPKLLQPRILPCENTRVEYLWTFDASSEKASKNAQAMIDCARHIRCVGWGIDMAVGIAALHESAPAPAKGFCVFSPATNSSAGTVMRVPIDGSLQSLERAHENFLRRIRLNPRTGAVEVHDEPGIARFATRAYVHSPTRPYCAFELCRPDDEDEQISFNPRRIKALVGMVRGLLGGKRVRDAMRGICDVDAMLLGHPHGYDGPRLSILPLLSIGHQHADARIRRLILAEPFGAEGAVTHLLAEVLNGDDLRPDQPNIQPARLIRLHNHDRYIRSWYARSSRTWASVSPVLLPGFDDRTDTRDHRSRKISATQKLARGEKLIFKALRHADIALPCRVELSEVSWWPGVPHARDFVPRDKLGPAPRYHVKLTFDQSFTGPLSIGRQRHMGLGVFAALDNGG
jgi:CRISPR-associated protein Csb2